MAAEGCPRRELLIRRSARLASMHALRGAELDQDHRPGLTTDAWARLPQPHNERCHQHDDG